MEEPRTPEDHLLASSFTTTFSWFSAPPPRTQRSERDSPRNIMASSSVESVPLHRRRHEREELPSEFSITPMTSRPHNCSFPYHSSPVGPPIRRVRSRSLGQAADLPSILLPPITVHTTKATMDDSEHQRTETTPFHSHCPEAPEADEPPTPVHISILYGMINATIVLPVLMSFSSIIYRDDAFDPFAPILVKLTVVSGIVHQLCFSTFSSLPFAVGQVQDAGLIFLSGMASTMVQYCHMESHDNETMIATVTVGLSLATAILGLGLVGIGYLKLAQHVQLLPTCVVGGYLAFIGWFCGLSGVGLMAGSSKVNIASLCDNIQFVLPGILGGVAIYTAVTQLRHTAALPVSIGLELLLFYTVLWITGTSISEATAAGWIRSIEAPPSWTHTWDFLRLDKVDWWAYPQLITTEIGMIFVVALSSSLDVAAIELELKRPLNYNHELKTVGLSNLISGLSGGYTGSYIFSQSIFSLRAGIRSRVAGYALAGCQILTVVAPFPILSYVPNFFFGSMLSMICIDLMFEWLWDVRTRLSKAEYFICLATFVLIQLLSVEYGILAGVALHEAFKRFGICGDSSKTSDERLPNDNDSLYDPGDHDRMALLDSGNGALPRYNSLTPSIVRQTQS